MTINDYFGVLGFSGLALALFFCAVSIISTTLFFFTKKISFKSIFRFTFTGQTAALSFAVFSLGWLLVNNAFEYPIVFDAVEKSMPWYYKFSGLWSGQSSSLLFWSFILSVFIAVFFRLADKKLSTSYAGVIALVLSGGLVFFLVPVIFISNPFEKLWQLSNGMVQQFIFAPPGSSLIIPVDGLGMNPSLRHPAMLLHPPTLYIGLIGFFMPFAFSLASLAIKDIKHSWVKYIYPVTIIAWIFLTAGMFLGSWWAYTILGWGGYWGWDAVEIAGLLPWLLSFGLIHSMQMQLRGKDFRRWIYAFSGLIVFIILSGILITRSGILESVHAYSAGVMGPVLSVLILLNIVPYFLLFIKHKKSLSPINSWTGRTISEKLAVVLNCLILLLVAIYFIGQTFPLTSKLITGEKASWIPAYYEQLSSPVLVCLMIITALYPLSDDKKNRLVANTKKALALLGISAILPVYMVFNTQISLFGAAGFWGAGFLLLSWLLHLIRVIKQKQVHCSKIFTIGSILIHLGFGLTAIGILGSENLSTEFDIQISIGEAIQTDGLSLFGQSRNEQIEGTGQTTYQMNILMSDGAGEPKLLTPDLEYYPKMDLIYARPAIYSNLAGDIQLILSGWQNPLDRRATIHVISHPLIIWIWIGGAAFILGGAIILLTFKITDN